MLESDSRSGCTNAPWSHQFLDFCANWLILGEGTKCPCSSSPTMSQQQLSPRPHLAKVPTLPLEDEAGAEHREQGWVYY